jgi:integrase/recombinase XerD
MPPLRQHMLAALQLRGKSARTPHSYVREVRLLAQFYGTSPHLSSASELQHDIWPRTNVAHLAPTSLRSCSSGIRFFSLHVLERAWKLLDLMQAQAAYRLPALLRVQAVRRLLSMATPLPTRGYFPTVSSLGLRRHDGLFLQASDLDGQRLMVHGHRGKGAKDRSVPLPPDTFAL